MLRVITLYKFKQHDKKKKQGTFPKPDPYTVRRFNEVFWWASTKNEAEL